MAKPVLYADPSQFTKGAAFLMQHFLYELPDTVSMEDILRPDFWRPLSDRIKRLSIITVIGGKDNIDVDIRCVGVGHGYCAMKVIRAAPSDSEFIDEINQHERHVEYRPGFQWCIIGNDGGMLRSNFETKDEAIKELTELGEAA